MIVNSETILYTTSTLSKRGKQRYYVLSIFNCKSSLWYFLLQSCLRCYVRLGSNSYDLQLALSREHIVNVLRYVLSFSILMCFNFFLFHFVTLADIQKVGNYSHINYSPIYITIRNYKRFKLNLVRCKNIKLCIKRDNFITVSLKLWIVYVKNFTSIKSLNK